MKCACCGSENLIVLGLSSMGMSGSVSLNLHVKKLKVEKINKARVCKECGNVMPFVEPKNLIN